MDKQGVDDPPTEPAADEPPASERAEPVDEQADDRPSEVSATPSDADSPAEQASDVDAGVEADAETADAPTDAGPIFTDDVVITAFGLAEASRQRLMHGGQVDLCEDASRLDDSDIVLVSTRLPRAQLSDTLSETLAGTSCPLVALTHTGGEAQAVEIVRAGGVAVIAEGNEASLAALLSDHACDMGLLESYARQVGRTAAGNGGARGRDPVTRLPDLERLEERLDELIAADDVPRVGAVRVLDLDLAARRLTPASFGLLRQRLARLFSQACESAGAELYCVDTSNFAFLATGLPPERVTDLGRHLDLIARTFSAGGVGPLEVVIGHAGAESSTNPTMLRELAYRALQVSIVDRSRPVVNADTLSVGSSGTVELETASQLLAIAEAHLPDGPGHGARVARVAGELARELGFEAEARTALEVAANFHLLGLASLPASLLAEPDPSERQVRDHPLRAWTYLRVCAGEAAATAVRHHAEQWDGEGYPDGLAGRAIPLQARVVALAIALERWRSNRGPDPRELAGTVLDPDLVPLAMAAGTATTDALPDAISA